MPGAIEVRSARRADAEALARFNEAMALETEGLRLDPETIRAGVCALLEDPAKGLYFVAERGGEVVGALLVTFEWSDWRNATYLWLQSVYVEPGARRQSVFRSLFSHVEELARSSGHCGIRLYVEKHNHAARRAYERLGMTAGRYLVMETRDRLRHAEIRAPSATHGTQRRLR